MVSNSSKRDITTSIVKASRLAETFDEQETHGPQGILSQWTILLDMDQNHSAQERKWFCDYLGLSQDEFKDFLKEAKQYRRWQVAFGSDAGFVAIIALVQASPPELLEQQIDRYGGFRQDRVKRH
jgi:hypothetical protein